MAAPGAKSRVLRLLKTILYALLLITLTLLTIATLRTFTLNVNVGLQLADWEQSERLGFNISQRQRGELLTAFKGVIITIHYSTVNYPLFHC